VYKHVQILPVLLIEGYSGNIFQVHQFCHLFLYDTKRRTPLSIKIKEALDVFFS
jgi:hypothetical protein